MRITHTVDVKGVRSVQIIDQVGDAKQRFATLQLTAKRGDEEILRGGDRNVNKIE